MSPEYEIVLLGGEPLSNKRVGQNIIPTFDTERSAEAF